MTTIALTARPELHFAVGATTEMPVDAVAAVARAQGATTVATRDHVAIETMDPVDAVIAWAGLKAELSLDLGSCVASAAAVEMLVGDPGGPARAALGALRLELGAPINERGICAVRHFSDVRQWPIPDELAEQRLDDPAGGLLLAIVGARCKMLHTLTTSPVTLGRTAVADLVVPEIFISRRHVAFSRSTDAWWVEDAGSTSGFYLAGRQAAGRRHELHTGMVLQFAIPTAVIVLAA